MKAWVFAATLVASAAAFAQEDGGQPGRPDEGALFGGADNPPPASDGPQGKVNQAAQEGEDARAASELGGPATEDKFKSGEVVEDPLKIGGTFYLRYFGNATEHEKFKDVAFSSPNLLDIYMDARPNDRVRGFARFRMRYDPTYDSSATNPLAALQFANPAANNQTSGTGTTSFGTTTPRQNPSFLLDQLWVNFDVFHKLYVTAGKQHVRWTVSRFWMPEDFLSPTLRDPLAVFDERTGASLVKIHFPIEKLGWNLYAITLLDNVGPANVFGELGEAFRGEFVIKQTEVGLAAVFQRGRPPRYSADVSSSLGPFDVYGEVAYRPTADRNLVRFKEGQSSKSVEFVLADQLTSYGAVPLPFETYRPTGPVVQTSVGANWSWAYRENDSATFGAEYFYNGYGYDDPNLFAAQLLTSTYVPFYAGRHYAGVYVALIGPGSMDNGSFVLSNLGNLSDKSFISRVDFSYRALTYLNLEAFAAYHYGQNGEFHYGINLPAQPSLYVPPAGTPGSTLTPDQRQQLQGIHDAGLHVYPPMFDFGVGVRISL